MGLGANPNIDKAIDNAREAVREIRKAIIDENEELKGDTCKLFKEAYSKLNYLLHDVEEVRRIALQRSK